LASQLREHLAQVSAQLARLLPRAEFHHIGATAIPGAVTKGDVDVLLRVDAAEFPHAVDCLRQRFAIKQAKNWTAVFASFGDDSSFPFPLGVQLVIRESEADIFLFLHEYLSADTKSLAEYNRIKEEAAPLGADAYWEAKNRFLSQILSSRPKRTEANQVSAPTAVTPPAGPASQGFAGRDADAAPAAGGARLGRLSKTCTPQT
jgi:GrpB-like predicted nucleotidyltransferase (UPF0157 family)